MKLCNEQSLQQSLVLRRCLHCKFFNRTLVFGLQYQNQRVYLSMVFRGVGLGKYYIMIMVP